MAGIPCRGSTTSTTGVPVMGLEKIDVGGFRYIIIPLEGDDAEMYHGLCNRETKTIALRVGDTGPDYADTVLHEVLHAVFHERSMASVLGAEQEEFIVSSLATGLIEVIRRNPEFLLVISTNALE